MHGSLPCEQALRRRQRRAGLAQVTAGRRRRDAATQTHNLKSQGRDPARTDARLVGPEARTMQRSCADTYDRSMCCSSEGLTGSSRSSSAPSAAGAAAAALAPFPPPPPSSSAATAFSTEFSESEGESAPGASPPAAHTCSASHTSISGTLSGTSRRMTSRTLVVLELRGSARMASAESGMSRMSSLSWSSARCTLHALVRSVFDQGARETSSVQCVCVGVCVCTLRAVTWYAVPFLARGRAGSMPELGVRGGA